MQRWSRPVPQDLVVVFLPAALEEYTRAQPAQGCVRAGLLCPTYWLDVRRWARVGLAV